MTSKHPLESLYTEELYSIRSKVLVIISKPWSEIREEEVALLGKILNAVKLSLAAVQVVTRTEFSLEDFKLYQPTCIISFGAHLKDSTKMYEALTVDGTPIVVAHELNQLEDTRKKNLWLTLKQVFST